MLDASGFVVGGTTCNIFMVRGSQIATPSLTRCGVKGVMRRVVLERAARRRSVSWSEISPWQISSRPTRFS